jgi:AmmeMemoRadiSam system protein A
MDPRVKLAVAAIEAYVRDGKTIPVPPDVPEDLLNSRAGVFVCLKKDGELRGCIGTIEPVQPCVAEEIVANAVSAAIHDPRFLPVSTRELDELEYSVDVLTPAEECSFDDLDPRQYGVIVECGGKRGLLLPDLEGVDTVDYQVDIARRKGGIGPYEDAKLYRFEVIRYK